MPISALPTLEVLEPTSSHVGKECAKTKSPGSKVVPNGDQDSDPLPDGSDVESSVNPFSETLQQVLEKSQNGSPSNELKDAQATQPDASDSLETPVPTLPAANALQMLVPGLVIYSPKVGVTLPKVDLQDVLKGKPQKADPKVIGEKASADVQKSGANAAQPTLCPTLLAMLRTAPAVSAPVDATPHAENPEKDTLSLKAVSPADGAATTTKEVTSASLTPGLNVQTAGGDHDTLVFEGKFYVNQEQANSSASQNSAPDALSSKAQASLPKGIDSLTSPHTPATEVPDSVMTGQEPSLIQAAATLSSKQNFSGGESHNEHNSSQAVVLPVPVSDNSAIEKNPTDNSSSATANSLSKSDFLPIDQQANGSASAMKNDLTVRLQGQSGENINIRLTERGGEVQIAIRSTDQATATALRHELPSIQAGLERAGLHMEGSSASQSGSSKDSSDSQGQDQQKQSRGNSPNWQGRRQQQKNSAEDQWFDLTQN